MTEEKHQGGRGGAGGRPSVPAYLRRTNFTIRLPQWLQDWIRDHGGSQGALIEQALRNQHHLYPPQGGDYLTTDDMDTAAAYVGLDSLPDGAKVLGTVTHPGDRSGALIELSDGRLIMYLAGEIRHLPPDIPRPGSDDNRAAATQKTGAHHGNETT